MLSHSPSIVTDGLVLCLDAANPRSYGGSGTTWYDLSGNGNNGTLVNGPTFNTGNLGSIQFDGVDDYIEIIGNNSNTPSSITLFCFVYPENTRPEEIIITQNNGSGYRFMTRIYANNTGTLWGFRPTPTAGEYPGLSILQNNNWYCLCITYTSSKLLGYLNGIKEIDINNPSTLVHGGNIRIGDGIGGAQRHLQGKIPVMLIYNRALTPQEIEQNFKATRGRFGI